MVRFDLGRGIACRRGLSSRTRHLETKLLWLQEAIARKRLCWGKVHTSVNPADLLTKVKNRAEASRLIELAGGRLAVRQANRCRQAEGGCWTVKSLDRVSMHEHARRLPLWWLKHRC